VLCAAAACRDTPRPRNRDLVLTDSAATAVLPAVGTRLRPFNYPTISGRGSVSNESLLGQPALIALWNGDAPESPAAMVEFDALMYDGQNAGMRFVVLANHKPDAHLDTLLRDTRWAGRVDYIGMAYDNLRAVFDLNPGGMDRSGERSPFRLPSFLLISESGRVIRRVAGLPLSVMKPAIDSLRISRTAASSRADSVYVAATLPKLEAALARFNPLTLDTPDTSFSLRGTCGGEGEPGRAAIPARIRVLSASGGIGSLYTEVEIVTVADLGFTADSSATSPCDAKHLAVQPRVRVDTMRADFEASDTRFHLSYLGRDLALFGLKADSGRTIEWPPDVTFDELRTRIDSIRRAKP
jgi:hypothetical protein